MNTNILSAAARLSDADLLSRVQLLAAREREALAELVAHLAELDTRRIYLAEGYGSLFIYCTAALGLSEHAAYNRIEAARVVRKFPAILDLLANGSVNLTTVRLLAPHLTSENHLKVLTEATRRSKRDVETLVAQLAPRPDVPASIRKLPDAQPARALAGSSPPPMRPPLEISSVTPQPPMHYPVVAPLAPRRYRLQFTVGKETHDKLRLVQDLLRREIPDGDPGAIFDRALTLLLEQVVRKKLAATPKPRRGPGTAPGSRHIPAEVKRAVWPRDGGRCAFVAKNGRRCTERTFLEFHHVEPFGVGGEATADNISLRCRRHNAHEAEFVFGPYVPSVVRESCAPYSALTERPTASGRPRRNVAPRTRSGTSSSPR